MKFTKGKRAYHLFSTHAQSGTSDDSRAVRAKQFAQLRDMLVSRNLPADEAVLIAGDLNVDAAQADIELDNTLSALNASSPNRTGHPFTFDPGTNRLALATEPSAWLDYVLFSNAHLRPISANITSVMLKTILPWKEFGFDRDYWDLSDH